jgi:hypothetical protein
MAESKRKRTSWQKPASAHSAHRVTCDLAAVTGPADRNSPAPAPSPQAFAAAKSFGNCELDHKAKDSRTPIISAIQ